MTATTAQNTVFFVDSTLPDLATLLAGLPSGAEVHLIEAGADGVQLLADTLFGRSGIQAIHLLTHGSVGSLKLGSSTLNSDTLGDHAAQWQTIRNALSTDADLLIYGCDVAAGDTGQSFIAQLAESTGADVAASDDFTGASRLGGDWVLEASTGSIEAQPADNAFLYQWNYVLQTGPNSLTLKTDSDGSFQAVYQFDGDIFSNDKVNYARGEGFRNDLYKLSGVTNGSWVKLYMGVNGLTDPYLQVTDETGAVIVQNDDAGNTFGQNSFDAYVKLQWASNYTIRATTYGSGATGSYYLFTDTGSLVIRPDSAPTFTSNAVTVSRTDTGANDDIADDSGTFTGNDTDGDALSFSIDGAASQTGTYGTLNVGSNGAWTWTANDAAINSLTSNASESFTIKVSDGSNPATQNFTVSIAAASANDKPYFTSSASLGAVSEDTTSPSGSAISTLFSGRYSDAENTSMQGIVVVADGSTTTQGKWQYSTGSGAWYDIGTVSTAAGLALSSATLLRFLPTPNWNGTPGSLTVHAVDSSTGISLTNGSGRQTFNTTTDGSTSAVSESGATVSTSITSVNDAPVFTTTTPVTLSVADTQATDSFTALTGTITASDLNGGAASENGTITYTIATGTSSGGFSTKTDAYGLLSINTSTGAYTYTPNADAVNALQAGAVPTSTFTINAADGQGSTITQTFTVNLTGANDRPVLQLDNNANAAAIASTYANLPTINEDVPTQGQAVADLLGSRVTDPDASSSFGGIIITANAAVSADQGIWQYKVSGGTWKPVPTTDLTTTAGLALDKTTSLRFLPNQDYNGAPGKLTVYATDNIYTGYTTEATPMVTANTTTASGVSATAKAVGITVTSVNDAPVITSAAGAATLSETLAYDGSATVGSGSLTGSLTATDVDGATTISYSVRGGITSGSTVTKDGNYGTLTLNTSANTWAYAVDNLVGLNALPAGANVTETFTLQVYDTDGATRTQDVVITLQGTNDLPILASALSDLTLTGPSNFTFQLPANSFTDAEGLNLTYTATLADNSALPSWLTFNETARTFSGTGVPGGVASLNIKVTASDGTASVSDVFGLNLSNFGNQAPVLANPVPQQVVSGAAASTAVTFSQTLGGSSITFDGVTVALGNKVLAATVASTLAAASNTSSAYTAAVKAGLGNENVLVLTAKNPGDELNDFPHGQTITTAAGSYTINSINEGGLPKTERAAFTFESLQGTPSTTTFDGVTIYLTDDGLSTGAAIDPTSAIAIAKAYAVGLGAATQPGETTNWIIEQWEGTSGNFSIKAKAPGPVIDLTTAAFPSVNLVDYNGTKIIFSPQGQAGGTEIVELTFTDYLGGNSINLAGISAIIGTSVTAPQVATAINGNTFTHYDTSVSGSTVTFVAKNGGSAITMDSFSYQSYTTPVDIAHIVSNPGGWEYTLSASTFTDADSDALTYSAWVNGVEITTGSSATLQFNPTTLKFTGDGTALPNGGVVEIRAVDAAHPLAPATTTMQFTLQSGTTGVTAPSSATPLTTTWTGAGSQSYVLPTGTFAFADGGALTFSAKLANNSALPSWLSFSTSTGKFSGNPPAGAAGALSIVITATDNAGAVTTATQALTLTITDPNDAPTVSSYLPDVTVSAQTNWSTTLGTLFADTDGAVGETIAYSAHYWNGTAWTALPTTADATYWLGFNPSTKTFSGNPPANLPSLNIKVSGTDVNGTGKSNSTTFTLNLADNSTYAFAANNPGAVTVSGTPNQGQTLTANAPTDTDGYTSPVSYQWQVSSDNGVTWTDVDGARGKATTLTLAQTESGKKIQVLAFYTDNAGVAEMAASTALTVADVDDLGVVTFTATPLMPEETLTALLSDADGLTNATPTYQWYRSTDGSNWGTGISGATQAAYTMVTADGNNFLRVGVTYKDDQAPSTNKTVFTATGTKVQLGAVKPVAVNDTNTVLEAGGIGNSTPAPTPATGNVLTNDTDVNLVAQGGTGDSHTVSSLRTGSAEGVGTAADDGATLTLAGSYGTLVLTKANGAYTYTLTQGNPVVEALDGTQSLTESFNYTVTDSTFKADIGVLNITITGAHDNPVITGTLPASSTQLEDVAGDVDLSAIDISDVDSAVVTVKLVASQGTLAATTADGVTVGGSATSTLTLTGSPTAVTSFLNTASLVQYTSLLHDNGTPGATLAVSYQDNSMGGTFTSLGTVNLNITAVNDAPAGTDKSFTILEDTPYTFTVADYGFTDLNDTVASGSTANSLVAVKITTLPANAEIQLDGVFVTEGSLILVADITAGKLKFVPRENRNDNPADNPTTPYTTFTFQVQDDGGTANNGVNLDPVADTFTFFVTPVNDAPVLVDGVPALLTHTEDENTSANVGNLVSDLASGTLGGTTAGSNTGMLDVDMVASGETALYPTQEAVGKGIAIYGLSNTGPADGGTWEYKLASGSWTPVGTFAANEALLLRSTDSIRFVPDTENATTATISYYLWDGFTGSAGNKVSIATRGGSTAFSTAGDEASIAITTINDAPTLDLDASAVGNNYSATFLPRGSEVAVVNTNITIADVDQTDRADVAQQDTITRAVVKLTAGAADNYEGIITDETVSFKDAGAAVTTWGGLTITGNATTELTITGTSTWANYQAALQKVFYNNANLAPTTGNRTIEVSVTDGNVTSASNGALTTTATTTVAVTGVAVVDMNGAGLAGSKNAVTFTEGQTGKAIATTDARIDNLGGTNLKEVVLTLSNPADGTSGNAESLFVSQATIDSLASTRGITVTGSGTHTVKLTASSPMTGVTADNMNVALRVVQYKNTSEAPTTTPRTVNVSVEDIARIGVGSTSTITVVPVNDAPVIPALSSGGPDLATTVLEGGLVTLTTTDLNATDVDDTQASLAFVVTTAPAKGTLFRDANGNGLFEIGEVLSATAGDGVITRFTQADIAANRIKYQQTDTLIGSATDYGSDSFAFKVEDGLEDAAVAPTGTFNLTITPVNDAPTLTATASNPAFSETAATAVGLFTGTAASAIETAQNILELKLTVNNLANGTAEKLVVDGQTLTLGAAGTTSVGGTLTGLNYAITVTPNTETATVTLSHTGLTPAQVQTLINGLAYKNTSISPAGTNRVVTLTSIKDSGGTVNGVDTSALSITSTVTISGNDNTPVLATNTGANLANGGLLVITTAHLNTTDADNTTAERTYTLTTAAPSKGSLFLDRNASGEQEPGEALTSGSTFTQADIDANRLKYRHNGGDNTPDSFGFTVTDGTTTLSAATFALTIASAGSAAGTGSTTANSTDGSDPLFSGVGLTPSIGATIKTLSFEVTGVKDGNKEILSVNGQNLPMVNGTTTVGDVTYTVLESPLGSGNFTVTMIDATAPGFSAAEANAIVNGTRYSNTAVPPTAGDRGVTLKSFTDMDSSGTPVLTTTTNLAATTTVAPATDLFTSDQATAAIPTPASGNDIQSLSFTVTGIQNGANEILKINGVEIPMVAGSTVVGGVTYTVVALATPPNPQGSFTVTMSDSTAPAFTELQAEAIVNGATLSNTASPATAGARSVTLDSVTVANASTGAVVSTTTPGTTSSTSTATSGTPVSPLTGESIPTLLVTVPASTLDTLTFTVTGVKDGANEVVNIGGTTIPFVPGTVASTTPPGSYVVTVDANGTATVVFTPTANLSEAEANTLVAGTTYTNTATPPTGGERTVALTSMDVQTGTATPVTTAVTTVSSTPVNVIGTTLSPGTGTDLFDNVNLPAPTTGSSVKSMEIGLTGIKDGASEVITINGQNIPLVPGSTTINGVTYTVVLDANGNGTLTITDSTAPGWNEAQAEDILNNIGYKNTASPATPGDRGIDVNSITQASNTDWAGTTTPITVPTNASTGTTVTQTGTNTAPTVTANTGLSVAEGQTFTLTSTHLAATDTESAAPSLVFKVVDAPDNGKLFRDSNGNGLVDGVEEIAANGTFTQAELTSGLIKYRHGSTETASDLFKFTVGDGLATSASTDFAITVTRVDDIPTLTATGLNPTFTEALTPVPVTLYKNTAPEVVVTTGDTLGTAQTLKSMTLTVSNIRDGASEKLIINGGAVGNAIELSGNTPSGDVGVVNGHNLTFTVSKSGSTTTVTLTHNGLTEAELKAVVESMQYVNTSGNPTAGARAVNITQLVDSGGSTLPNLNTAYLTVGSAVTVSASDATPTLTTASLTVTEGSSAVLTSTQLVASDADTPVSSLTYKVTTAPSTTGESAGLLYIDTNSNAVNDGSDTTLAVGSTFSYADLVGNKIRYQHGGGETADASLGIAVGDGTTWSTPGAVAISLTNINDAPVLAGLNTDVLEFLPGDPALLVDVGGNATVADPDPGDLAGGVLRVNISLNRDVVKDVLSIKNVGTSTDQISVNGADVSYGGTSIGTLAGGTGTNDLTVTLNGSATRDAVQALVRAIQFQNTDSAPTVTSRTLSVTLSDGDGDTSLASQVQINFRVGGPSFLNGSGFYVAENTQMVTSMAASDASAQLPITYTISPRSIDSNLDATKFAIDATTGILSFVSAPNFESPTDVGVNNVYNVVVRATNKDGNYTEAGLAVNVVDVTNESGPAPGDLTGPLFGFATVNGTSLAMTYTDASNLDATNSPPASAFLVSGHAVTGVAVNATAKTVTLTLGTAVTAGEAVTVSYTDPTTGINDAVALQDAAGNDAATLAATAATNLTPSTSSGGGSSGGGGSTGGGGSSGGGGTPTPPPTPTPDTTPPAFAFATVNGNTLVMTYTDATNALDAANPPPASAFAVSGNTVVAVVVDASAKTVILILDSAVQAGTTVSVSYTDPGSGNDTTAIQDSAGNDAASLIAAPVTNLTAAADIAAPVFSSATVNANTLVMTFTDANALDAGRPPPASAFVVSANTVTGVLVNASAKTVTLTLANAVLGNTAVTVRYTDPSTGNDSFAIQDAAGNDAASLTSTPVTNLTPVVPDTIAPVFTGATVNGSSLVMSYSDTGQLDAANPPPASAFTVSGNTVTGVSVNAANKSVTLSLGTSVTAGATVTVSYTDPGADNDSAAVQDGAGNDAASLSAAAVTNLTPAPDSTPPVITSATVNGTALVLTYSDANLLEAGNLPSTSRFAVSNNTVTAVSVNASAKTVTLALGASVHSGDVLTVSYTDPTTGDDANAIQDIAGNDAVSFAGMQVSNSTSAPEVVITTDDKGNTTVTNDGDKTGTVSTPPPGSTVTLAGAGDNNVVGPRGEVTINNTGSGTTTTSGIQGGSTLNLTGSGTQVIDLSGVAPGQTITIQSDGSGNVDILNLPDGVIVNITGDNPVRFGDNDGIAQSIEDRAKPLGSQGKTGDGNGDGTPDALQSNVTSAPFRETAAVSQNPQAPEVFVSLVADSREGKIDTTDANSASLVNVRQLDAPAGLPAGVNMPLGLIAFSATVGLSTNATPVTETFSLYVDSTVAINGYWKLDAGSTWVNLASVVYGGAIVTEGGKTRLDFKITDGGQFDADRTVNGTIVDPGAAGFVPLSLVGFAPELPAGGFWF